MVTAVILPTAQGSDVSFPATWVNAPAKRVQEGIAAGIYVLSHLGDSLWGGGAEERLDAPSLADTPVVGQFLGPLDALLNAVVDGVKEFTDFRAPLPVAVEFLAAAGWALAAAVPLGLVVLVVGY